VKWDIGLGATLAPEGVRFLVWAPNVHSVQVRIVSDQGRLVQMERRPNGYHEASIAGLKAGTDYLYVLDGGLEQPDPASHYQPFGVHGPSRVVDHAFAWSDSGWSGLAMQDFVIYELHVGTFTPEGTFDAVIPHLPYLRELGITAIELMPVAQFPGRRNWGYDGVFPYAVQDSYGGPEGLRRLVDAAHGHGLAVVLDVVYNHLGPEGNHLSDFGPYFTQRYHTPWGAALNFDDAESDEVRRFFIGNALYWLDRFHIDALRLDAVHAIVDTSAVPLLEELAAAVHDYGNQQGRRVQAIAESDLNDARIIRPRELGGFDMDAQWTDDFHHSLHALLTGERQGYYAGFGEMGHMAKALSNGFVYTGEYAPHRRRRYGNSPGDLPGHKFVVATQNHDQVGNRMLGERLSALVSFEAQKLAAGVLLLSPFVPLVFMGEEYGELAPFQYFVSHGDPHLVESVRKGRKEEFRSFGWQGELPDPQAEATFERSRLDLSLREKDGHRHLLALYRELLHLRRELPALRSLSRQECGTEAHGRTLVLRRHHKGAQALAAFNFSDEPASVLLGSPSVRWRRRLDSAAEQWAGPGAASPVALDGAMNVDLRPNSFVLYERSS
jgi:maltooligosyltrehalose trehalohydrolase